MKYVRTAAILAAVTSVLSAQAVGPDVIVGDLIDTANYGSGTPIGGVPTAAFAIGTTSCNLGTAELSWFAGTNNKPVIGQSIYRLKDGRFEQIGIGWLKHGFFALAENACGSCQVPANFGNFLGLNCSDPYTAGLNGDQGNIGPRFEVNPFTGFYPWPYTLTPTQANNPATTGNENTTLAGRINVVHTDLDPAVNAGAQYFAEGQYIHPTDASSGNGFNNVSYRPLTVSPSGGSYNINLSGAIVRQKAALWAWAAADASVVVKNVDVPGEGRFVVGYKSTALGGGMYHHEYAVFNQNSDRAGAAFTVFLPSGVTAVTAADHFKDVAYHSGEPQDGVDWALTNTPGAAVNWACTTAAPSDTANALRWGTLYNFRFDAAADWLGSFEIGLFKSGTPAAVQSQVCRTANVGGPITGGPTSASVAYDFIDASGGAAGPAGNDVGMTVNLPFTFNLLGTNLNQIVISTNGYLAIPGQLGFFSNNTAIPNPVVPNGIIAGYWDDLDIGNSGAQGAATGWCRYTTVGTAPNRRFVVQWNDAQRFLSNNSFSFEIILDETTNHVTLTQISTAAGATGGTATRGIENASGTQGLQIGFNQANVVAMSSVRIFQNPYVYADSALLTLSGNGSIATPFKWNIVSDPNAAITLFADVAPGPTLIPALQANLGLGLTPGLLTIADGTGLFGPLDPTAYTGSCNEWTLSLPVSLDPISPAAIDVWFQALVWSNLAPNGFVRTTTTVTY